MPCFNIFLILNINLLGNISLHIFWKIFLDMRHPKKHYYETVLRLTLLASILRQTNIDLFSPHNHITKHIEPNCSKSYLDEIVLFGRLSYLIAPASLLVQNPSQKDLLTFLHDNSFSKEVPYLKQI